MPSFCFRIWMTQSLSLLKVHIWLYKPKFDKLFVLGQFFLRTTLAVENISFCLCSKFCVHFFQFTVWYFSYFWKLKVKTKKSAVSKLYAAIIFKRKSVTFFLLNKIARNKYFRTKKCSFFRTTKGMLFQSFCPKK